MAFSTDCGWIDSFKERDLEPLKLDEEQQETAFKVMQMLSCFQYFDPGSFSDGLLVQSDNFPVPTQVECRFFNRQSSEALVEKPVVSDREWVRGVYLTWVDPDDRRLESGKFELYIYKVEEGVTVYFKISFGDRVVKEGLSEKPSYRFPHAVFSFMREYGCFPSSAAMVYEGYPGIFD